MKQLKKMILASQSPRRIEILKNAGYQFVSFPVYVSEIPNKNLRLDEQILDIAKRKSDAASMQWRSEPRETSDYILLTADTLVCVDEQILGKPENEQIAFEYLKLLSGRVHQVKTAVGLLDLSTNEYTSHIETTDVHFRTLSDVEIQNYILTKEPFDKAGAYGIQGEGGALVQKFNGDYQNVVGLPLHAIENIFKLKEWDFQKTQHEI